MQARMLAALSVALAGALTTAWQSPTGIPAAQGRQVWNARVTYGKETKGQYVNETIRVAADYQLSDSGLPLKGSVRLSDVGKVNSPGSGGKGGSGPDYQDYAVMDSVSLGPREASYPTLPGHIIEGGASPMTLPSGAVLTVLVLPGVASQRAGGRVFVRGDAEMRLELQATYPRAKTVGAGATKQRADLGIGVRACVTARCGNMPAPKNAAQQQMMGQEMMAEMMRAQQGGREAQQATMLKLQGYHELPGTMLQGSYTWTEQIPEPGAPVGFGDPCTLGAGGRCTVTHSFSWQLSLVP